MAGGGGSSESTAAGTAVHERTLEYTPTWIVAAVCSVLVLISLLFERMLHRLGKRLLKRSEKTKYEALLKIQKELMLLGFISLMLGVLQSATQKICVDESVMRHLLPCRLPSPPEHAGAKYGAAVLTGGARRLLSGGGAVDEFCLRKGKVPILSLEALHKIDIFIFSLAATHVVLSVLTFVVGVQQTKKWRHWEEKIQQNDETGPQMIKSVQEFKFIRDRFKGHGIRWQIYGWMRSFFKQFYNSVTEEDYTAMRLGFIAKHCKGNTKFNFYNYMVRAFEADFKKVIGISWYLWALLMIFLLLNVHGWHVYTWISLAPFLLLLVVGSKMEHIITELAVEVAQKHTAIEGDVVVAPSDDLFWFHRPKLVLHLIHIILFQIAFEIAFFFWLLGAYGYTSCIMGKQAHVIARLVLSIASRILCGYSTLPLYVIVSHMGTSFKKAIFDDNVSEGLINWAQSARRCKGKNKTNADSSGSPIDARDGPAVQMTNA